jgi:phosphodiesterase/alkaline phosphatase D-like protein
MKRTFAALVTAMAMAAVCAAVALGASNPLVATGKASSITTTSATLNATVNPASRRTSYLFQYGLTTGYGLTTSTRSAGSGSKTVSVKLTASGLIPGTVYHYRVVAYNSIGTSYGQDRAFTSSGHPPPGALTGATLKVGHEFAVLTGTVVPNGQATSWLFQYGPAANDYTASSNGGTVAANSLASTVAVTISPLPTGTTFHYRLVALHGNAYQVGQDESFTTLPFPRPLPRVTAKTTPHRARSKPYVFITTGSIRLPASIPTAAGCNGIVAVRYFVRTRSVAVGLATVQPDCTYMGEVTFRKLVNHQSTRLRVEVRFRGNAYLASTSAGVRRVRLG